MSRILPATDEPYPVVALRKPQAAPALFSNSNRHSLSPPRRPIATQALNGAKPSFKPGCRRPRTRVQSVVLEPAMADDESTSFDKEDEEMLRGLFSMLARPAIYWRTPKANQKLLLDAGPVRPYIGAL